jgi:hypothetical protein
MWLTPEAAIGYGIIDQIIEIDTSGKSKKGKKAPNPFQAGRAERTRVPAGRPAGGNEPETAGA